MLKIVPDTNINFIGMRKYAYLLSGVMLVLGLIAFVMTAMGNANMGIDFTGGVMLKGHFQDPVEIDNLRAALTGAFSDAAVTELTDFSKPNAYIIKWKLEAEPGVKQESSAIKNLLAEKFPTNPFTVISEHTIGPAVGEDLRRDAIWAVLISVAGILGYIWVRFDFRFGVAATAATMHDVLGVLGICYLISTEFNLLYITALLTMAGYSLTDKVVVFDRIRENLQKYRSRSEFVHAVNRSINEVLSRTINTGMSVLIVLIILFNFGGEVLQGFSLAMILGILISTYGSIFVASPIMVEWEARRPSRFK
ncbi:MAG: protein translocase subunit SecF [Candidatus Zixiibacteriota bacterium]